MPPPAFERRWAATPDPRTRDDLVIMRCRFDIGFFAKWCWPATFGRPWNEAHRHLLAPVDPPAQTRGRVALRAIAAPRGIAKTTIAKARVAHALVFGLDRCSLIISAERELAAAISDDLRGWFVEEDSELARLFAPPRAAGPGQAAGGRGAKGTKGPFQVRGGKLRWSMVGWTGRRCGVIAKSFGTQIRGSNIDGERPTRMVVDDGERPDRVGSPRQRARAQQFLEDDILKAGPVTGGLVVEWVGTVLHPDAILARLLKHPGWDARRFQAVERWPDRADLWEACRLRWCDLSLGDVEAREAEARAFYAAHRAEMDLGVELLDPVAVPIFSVYLAVWSQGMRSVLRELQNDPRDPAAAVFDSARFARCRVERDREGEVIVGADGRRVRLADCRLGARWDPSVGVSDGDFAAIAVIAWDSFGVGYLLQVWMRRAKPGEQLEAMWALAERWGVRRASLESNGFQRLLADDFARQQRERREAGRYWQLDLTGDPSTTDKVERIAGLEVPLSAGWLQINEAGVPAEVLAQFDDFPTADHDDGPDAVEGCWARKPGFAPKMVTERRR